MLFKQGQRTNQLPSDFRIAELIYSFSDSKKTVCALRTVSLEEVLRLQSKLPSGPPVCVGFDYCCKVVHVAPIPDRTYEVLIKYSTLKEV